MPAKRRKTVRDSYKPMLHHLEVAKAIPAAIRKHKLRTQHDVINHYAKLHHHPHSWMLHKEVMRQMGGGKPNAHYGFQRLVEPGNRHAKAAKAFRQFRSPHDVVHHLMSQEGHGMFDFFKKVGSSVVNGAKWVGGKLKSAFKWGKKAAGKVTGKLGSISSGIQKTADIASSTLGALGELELIDPKAAATAGIITGGIAEGLRKKVDTASGAIQSGLAKAEKFEEKLGKGANVLKQSYQDLRGSGMSIPGSGMVLRGSGLVL